MVQLGSLHFSATMVSILTLVSLSPVTLSNPLADIHQNVSLEVILVGDWYKSQADRHRSATPSVVGDQVWLLRRHIDTTRPWGKLDYNKLGPSCIIECINPVTFRLELPPHFRIHNIFHVSLLEPHHPSTILGRYSPPPPPIELSIGEEYEVDKILDSRWHRRQLQYLVLWKGYPILEETWEPTPHLENASIVLHAFYHANIHKNQGGLVGGGLSRRIMSWTWQQSCHDSNSWPLVP